LNNLDHEKENALKSEWRKKNPDLNKEIQSRWYYKNIELAKSLSRKWYYDNPEKVYKYHVEKYAANPDKAKRNALDWSRKNPTKVAAIRHSRRSQKSKTDSFTYSQIDQMLVSQSNKCNYCHKHLDKFHIDHVMPLKLGGGNNIENIQLLCPNCNLRKGAKHPDIFRKLVNVTS
jgi:5-methylcytosine-specific restriction endonuclease McrA